MDTARFLKALYGDMPAGYVEVRLLHRDSGIPTKKLYRPLPLGTVDERALLRLCCHNENGYNIYFQVAVEGNNRIGHHGKADVLALSALWFDVDKADEQTEDRLLRLPNPPDILVKSGKGYHGYYLLPEPVMVSADNLARIEQTLDGIAFTVGGDRACKNVNRILRLPGFKNVKACYPEPLPCEVVACYPNDRLHDFTHYEREYAVFGAAPAPIVTRYIPPEAIDRRLPERTKKYLQGGAIIGNRNNELFINASHYRDCGRSVSEAQSELGARAASDGLSAREIRQAIQSAYRYAARVNLPAHMKNIMAMEDSLK